MKKFKKWITDNLHWLILVGVGLLCLGFLLAGSTSDGGFITLDGLDSKISQSTLDFIDESKEALARLYNTDKPTEQSIVDEFDHDAVGLGFHTTLDDILARRKPDGDNDGGLGWQCSKYTAYLATGIKDYSRSNPDYGPANGKDMAAWLVRNYGFKYIDEPVAGAIGSGGFSTLYGHTVMYVGDGKVNDANWSPLKVSTHTMDLTGYVWVVPGDYEPPKPEPEPIPEPEPPKAPDTGIAF